MARRNLKNLRLRCIAAVDRPCQEHAKALVIKRAFSADERQRLADSGAAMPDGSFPIENVSDLENAIHAIGRASNPGKAKAHIISRARALGAVDKLPESWNVKKLDELEPLLKYICENDGAHSFSECLAENKFDQNVWPCVDALSQSIRSIVGDSSLTGGDREAQISASVAQFLQAVRDISPEISKQLEPLLVGKREGSTMTLEEALALIETQKSTISGLETKLTAAEKAKTDAMQAKEEADENCKTAKAELAKATDETIQIGGEEVKKSEVGAANFKTMKAIADERDTATLEKRATEEFPHVVGTPAEKAAVLKLVNSLPDDHAARKSLEAIMTSAEKLVKAGFGRRGAEGGDEPTTKAAQITFDQKVAEIKKRDNCSTTQAMSKARIECPAEYAAAFPESVDSNDSVNA